MSPPPNWSTSSVKGLRARGGYEVDIDWADGRLTAAAIRNISGDGKAMIRYAGKVSALDVPAGATITFRP